jgi:hypothetical protein
MRPIIGTFFGGKKSTQSPPIPIACFNYTFVNGSGSARVAFGVRCDGTDFVQILLPGQSTTQCLFEGSARGFSLTITKGSACS